MIAISWGKPNQKSIQPSHWDCCLIGSVIKHNRTGTFQWVWLPNSNKLIKLNQRKKFDFVLHKDKMLPVLIESERSPSRINAKQFDDKNISINAELANQKSYRYSDWKSIKSHFVKTFGGTEHLEMWLIKNTWPTPSLQQKNDWPTPEARLQNKRPTPSVKTWIFGFLLITQ